MPPRSCVTLLRPEDAFHAPKVQSCPIENTGWKQPGGRNLTIESRRKVGEPGGRRSGVGPKPNGNQRPIADSTSQLENGLMQTDAGIRWQGIPTPMDRLFFPSIAFGGGGAESCVTLLVAGTPSFVLRFTDVQAVCGYSETVYWSLAAERSRPVHALNLVLGSPLLASLRAFRHEPRLEHFLVCGGDMCCEVIAFGAYALSEYPNSDLAEAALAREMTGTSPDGGPADWRSPAEPWV